MAHISHIEITEWQGQHKIYSLAKKHIHVYVFFSQGISQGRVDKKPEK